MQVCGPILYYTAGEVAVIVLEGEPGTITEPKISAIFNPALKMVQGFPAPLHPFSPDFPGIFIAKFQLPNGKASNGTYLCVVEWQSNNIAKRTIYTIIVGAKPAVAMSAIGI